MRRVPPSAVWLAAALFLLALAPAASSQGCSLGLQVSPPVVHYPGSLPAGFGEPTFGEVADVTYPSSLANQTIYVQYKNGSTWTTLQSFTANNVGFTETYLPLTAQWAEGTVSLRVVGGSCSPGTAGFGVTREQDAMLLDVGIYAALVAGGTAFLLAARKLKLGAFVVLAAGVYLALSPFTGQRYDVYFLLSSGIRILQHVDPFQPGTPPAYPSGLKWAYPPLYSLYSALSFLVYQGFTGAALPGVGALTWPGWLTSVYNVWEAYTPSSLPVLVLLLKLPMIASTFGTAALIVKMTGKKVLGALWLANPLVLFVTAVWGQIDPIATFFAVAALYYYRQGGDYRAYFLASIGAAVKVWPALLVPLFLAARLKQRGRAAAKPLTALLPGILATLGVYAAFGGIVQNLSVFLYSRGVPTYTGQFSVNGLTWQQVLLLFHSPPVSLFLFLALPAYALIALRVYQTGDADTSKWVVVSILVFYLTYNYVNPQYFFWILPFLMLQGRRVATWVFTALPLLYIALEYNIFYFVSPAILPDEFTTGAAIADQLKLSSFSSPPTAVVLVPALLLAAVYLLLAVDELRSRRPAVAPEPGSLMTT